MEKYDIGKSSASLYLRNFEKLKGKMTEEQMKDPQELSKALADLKDSTKRTHIMAVMKVLGSQDKLSKDEMDTLGQYYVEITKNVENERDNKTRITSSIDFSKILTSLNAQINSTNNPKKATALLQDKLMVLVNSEIPPRRAMDWYDMEIVPDKTTDILEDDEMKANYYNLKVFVFKKFKTRKSHGIQVVKPTKRIKKTIQQMLDLRGDDPGEYLFLTKQGKKMTNPTFNKNLQRVLGASTNQLRKLYANSHIDTAEVKKALEVAKEMGHSIETAVDSYYDQE